MKDKELSPERSLQLIEEMMGLAKHKVSDNAFHFLLWGVLVIIASLSHYVLLQMAIRDESNLVWAIMPVIGAPLAMIYEFRKNKKSSTKSPFDKIYGQLWLGFFITLMVIVFINISNNLNPIASILAVVGLATFVSGALYRFWALFFGAVVFWVAAGLCVHLNEEQQLLLNALAIFLGYIIPGILLWKKSEK